MNALPQYRFIIARLCDNDYGYRLKDALRSLVDNGDNGVFEFCPEFCPIIAKKYIIEHVVSSEVLSNILQGREGDESDTRRYLEKKLRVEFCLAFPTLDLYGEKKIDHAGGSAYYDVASDQVYTF